MINIYKYMKDATKEVAKQGVLKYLEEYSYPDETIIESNFHLPLLRVKRKSRRTYRAQLFSAVGKSIYENLNITNNDWHSITPFLSSIELILSSAFVIDDIADKQEKRFDNDSTWKKYGLNEAIFAAFRLREIAEKIIIDKQNTSLENKVKILDLISDIHRKIYDGQTLNDKLINDYNHEIYIKRTEYFGAVFVGCVAKGSAILANANGKQIKLAEEIGNNYGTAIMIRNDLKDYMTSELIHFDHGISKALKRIPLEDFRIGRITYPLHIALGNKRYKDKLQSLIGKEKLTLDEEKRIVSMIAESKGFDKTIDLIEDYKKKALKSCKELPENESKYILIDLINLMKNSRDYTDLIKKEVLKN